MTEQPKTKEVQVAGLEKPVTIWKLNYGFSSDVEDFFTEIKTVGKRREMSIKSGQVRLGWLAHGIYECEELGIPRIRNISLGFSEDELNQRLAAVRTVDKSIGLALYDLIVDMNNEDEPDEKEVDEYKKKLATS